MKTRLMIGVEYYDDDIDFGTTYEIFDSIKKAKKFAETLEKPVKIFVADFNAERIYKEKGEWNYEDFADTYFNLKDIVHYPQPREENLDLRGI